jgi:CubicO group peptidase (beta-lactamase class C family)
VDELLSRARREVDEGLLPSCQVALGYEGELVAFEAFGDATVDTTYCVFSATKPFVAGVMWQLIADGSVDVDAKVADVIPEFGTNGKDVVTIEQVMLHTSGFPHAPLGPPAWATREGRLERFAQWRLNWEPGTAFEYHATSAHWVLAEIIDRVTGSDYRVELTRRILEPLGLRFRLGVPVDEQDGIAALELRGEPATPEEIGAIFGVPEMPVTEVTDEALLGFNTPEARAVGVPGGGGIGRAADLALYHQALLHDRRACGTRRCWPTSPAGSATRSPTRGWAIPPTGAWAWCWPATTARARPAGSATAARPARSATTAPPASWPGPTPPPACRWATSPTASTSTSSARPAAASASPAAPPPALSRRHPRNLRQYGRVFSGF